MSKFISRIKTLVEETPEERNRVVDLLRVLSILVVIFGHWLMAAITVDGGALVPGHLLSMAHWTHPLTWILQVMPVFFFVGGYSNALSWRSARRRSIGYGGWLRARLRRLVLPVVPLLIVWGLGGWLAIRAGLDWESIQLASQVAVVPTWFLAAYVVIVALAPLALKLWERFGWGSVLTAGVLAGLVDAISIGSGVELIGFLNYVFVWGAVHQLGYAWVDGRLDGHLRRLSLGLVGVIGLLLLVLPGPYATAMVGAGADGIDNSFPPRVTLLFLGFFQAGIALLAEPVFRRLASLRVVWGAVIAVGAQIMTLYLWHLTAMVLVIGASLFAGGFGLGLEPNTASWWLSRPIWFAILTVVTGALALAFARYERPGPDLRPQPRAWRPVMAVTLSCLGLALLAKDGIAGPEGIKVLVVASPLVGLIVGGVGGARLARRRTGA